MEAEKKAGRPKGSKNKQRAFNFEYTDKHGHKYSKSELIRKFATTFPNAKPKEIAERYRLTPKFVSQVLWAWRKKNEGIVPVKFVHEVTKAEVTSHVKEQHEAVTARAAADAGIDMVNNPHTILRAASRLSTSLKPSVYRITWATLSSTSHVLATRATPLRT